MRKNFGYAALAAEEASKKSALEETMKHALQEAEIVSFGGNKTGEIVSAILSGMSATTFAFYIANCVDDIDAISKRSRNATLISYLKDLRSLILGPACHLDVIVDGDADKEDFDDLEKYIQSALPESYEMLGGRAGDVKGLRSLMFVAVYGDISNIKETLPRERGLA